MKTVTSIATSDSQQTIVLTGAGSGGHITPILAVAAELKQLKPAIKLVYIGQKGDGLADIPAKDSNIDEVFLVRAGKFRRYHGEGIKQLVDVSTTFKNFRDFFYVLAGTYQSWKLLRRIKPQVVFIKGGFVGVPVGLAAAKLHIAYVTHDSDAIAGLANKIIARWAKMHAVAVDSDGYPYSRNKTVVTGIPLQSEFQPVNGRLEQQYRTTLQLPAKSKMLFVIGGGLGSKRINDAVCEIIPHLLHEFRDLIVVHATGRANKEQIDMAYQKSLSANQIDRLKTVDYIDDVYRYSGAADLIVSRAGATNLAEFALQGKACIVIPSGFLAGGHQLKNAQNLAKHDAAVVLDENDLVNDPNRLATRISELLSNDARRHQLGVNLSKYAKPNATADLAKLILEQA